MSAAVTWSVEPASAGAVENGKLKCVAEGVLTVRAAAGVSATRNVIVTSPLTGTWVRRADELAGMKLRIDPAGDSSLAGHIVGPPTDDAVPAIKAANKNATDDAVEGTLGCEAHVWAPGLKKWDKVKRLGATRWALEDLWKDVKAGGSVCRENQGNSRYAPDYELALSGPDRLEERNLKVAGPPQIWERTLDLDDKTIASARTVCDKARESAQAAYAAVLPGVLDNQKQVNEKFWGGNGSLADFKSTGLLASTLTAAQSALSDGAYKARKTAHQVPSTEMDPGVHKAVEASQAMFNGCKDVSP